MPVMLDGSNININYSTSNFDIQSVKSELYIPDTTNNSGNIINVPIGMNEMIKQPLSYEPMNTNIIFEDFTFKTEEIRTFTHSGGTENQTTYNLNIPQDTICDILIVGGGGGGGQQDAGGGGAGGLVLVQNILLSGLFTLNVGKGGGGGTTQSKGDTGYNSTITKSDNSIIITANGGGGGGGKLVDATNGGSGGGGRWAYVNGVQTQKSQTQIGISAPAILNQFGEDGGHGGGGGVSYPGGGGGGAGGPGATSGANETGQNGGLGIDRVGTYIFNKQFSSSIGDNGWFAGGGGSAGGSSYGYGSGGNGLFGGGGNGDGVGRGINGIAGTGGGGGSVRGTSPSLGGNGGSGIIIIKFIKVVNAVAPEEIRTFTHNGSAENQTIYNLNIEQDVVCDILIVGGGGAGGGRQGAGGGAGGLMFLSNQTLTKGTHTIKVGKGGDIAGNFTANNGRDSELGPYIAYGGSGGAGYSTTEPDFNITTNRFGSGGGGLGWNDNSSYIGYHNANERINQTNPSIQGGIANKGGRGYQDPVGGDSSTLLTGFLGGGGGGAGGMGQDAIPNDNTSYVGKAGNGGFGLDYSAVFGTNVGSNGWFAGGGGGAGASISGDIAGTGNNGGLGGGGNGNSSGTGLAGTNGTGGGGGGGGYANQLGGVGGSGIVIIKFKKIVNTEEIRAYYHSGGAENQSTYNLYVGPNTICDILIVAGGGAGGGRQGGGGGAGGIMFLANQKLVPGTHTIKVGKGGTISGTAPDGTTNVIANNGIDSEFGNYIAYGGSGGAGFSSTKSDFNITTNRFGSGGGATGWFNVGAQHEGWHNANERINQTNQAVIGGSAYKGGRGWQNYTGGDNNIILTGLVGGGGGGAGGLGQDAIQNINNASYTGKAGDGGVGLYYGNLFGTNIGHNGWFGGGGGGSGLSTSSDIPGNGGKGGGGNGNTAINGVDGMNGTGGGGGAGGYPNRIGGIGGSGIVIVRLRTIICKEEIRTYTHSGGSENQSTYNLSIEENTLCDILVVGGGGGGGKTDSGGGGAGGLIYITNAIFKSGTYVIKVGKGGLGGASGSLVGIVGEKGQNSSFTGNNINYEAYGGGGGGYGHPADVEPSNLGPYGSSGGLGTSDQTREIFNVNTPGQGYLGGLGRLTNGSGGGGGSGGPGVDGINGGHGGIGTQLNIAGTNLYYAGGGGGGHGAGGSTGGLGGGGSAFESGAGSNATFYGGGGGGGGGGWANGGNGFAGVVIIKLKTFSNNSVLNGSIQERNSLIHKTLNFSNNENAYINYLTGMDNWVKIKHKPANKIDSYSGNTFNSTSISGTFTIGNPNDNNNEWAIEFNEPNVKFYLFVLHVSQINSNYKDLWMVFEPSEMKRSSTLISNSYIYNSGYIHAYKTAMRPNGFAAKNSTNYNGPGYDQFIYNRTSTFGDLPDPNIYMYYINTDGTWLSTSTQVYADQNTHTGGYIFLPVTGGVYVKYDNDIPATIPYNRLTFNYRTDESPYSWQEAYSEALSIKRRLPTINELKLYITNYPSIFTQWNNLDYWTPVINPLYTNGKDWVQIGNNVNHVRGKSHAQETGGYPSWGDNSTSDYSKIYFDVFDTPTPKLLTFSYRTDESPYSWQEAYDEAITNSRRIPTIIELREYITNYPNVFTQWNNLDYWTPVINVAYANSKDWVQIGNNATHIRGKSHNETLGYPSWGDSTTNDVAKIYFEVIETYLNTHFVTFEPGTQVEINEDKFLTLDNEYIISLSNTSALVRKIINNTIENTNTINTINNINTINTINTTNNIIYNVTNKNFITMKYSNMKETNKYAIERMYPPLLARNFTSTTNIVSGQSYGNGTYIVTGSSIFHTGQLQIIPVDYTHPCYCFNESNAIGGHWAITNYDTSFNYVRTNKIIESFDDGLYYGEWLKIKLPIAIKLTKYSIKQRLGFSSNSPGKFRIYGSNNDIDWVLLIDRTSSNITYINGLYTEITFNIYSEYIFFVLVVGSTLSSRILNFDEWYLYGDEITNIIEPVVTPGITSIERMYPPVRNFTAATTTLSGQSYGNGTYIVSSSSEYDSVNESKFNIFNGTNQGWTQQWPTYGGTPSGTYTGSFSLAGYSGEWVKVQLPVPINLTRYIIEAGSIGGTSRVPSVYKIFGSNDNINWVELVNKSNPLVVADYVSSKYEEKVSTSNYYRYFALVVNKNMGLDIWLSIGELYIYGKESYDLRTFVHSGGSENQTSHSITFEQNTLCDILIVGGGGGGGYFGGGGGGGSILFATNIILNGTCTIKTGKGGLGVSTVTQNGNNGQDSSITINGVEYIAKGGGGGGTRNGFDGRNGNEGGSGGGGSHSNSTTVQGLGGISNKNTYSGWLSYGNNGGKGRLGVGTSSPDHASGGGGGAGSAGSDFTNSTGGGNGGSGLNFSSTFGTSVGHSGWFGGGGGGNTYQGAGNIGYGNGGNGLLGGGGNGGFDGGTEIASQDGLPNTGGGGGGSKWDGGTAEDLNGGHGGSGIVIIRIRSNVGAATTIGNPVSQELLTFNYVPRYPFVDKSLLLHYKFDELGNGEGYLDSSGNGYNLTAKAGNIPIFSRLNYVLGRAAFENGSSGSTLVIPNEVGSQLRAINVATGISLSFWFNLSITNQKDNWADILCFMVGTDANKRGIIIGQQTTDAILTSSTDPTTWISSSNRLFVGMQDGATFPYGYVGKGKLDREWHHFVWTITTAGVWAIYIDNVLQTYENVNQSTSGIIPNYSYTTNEFFGGSQVGHNNGYIDDFRIYKGVLTTAEITTLYNINSPEYPKIPADNANLKAWYKFDDEGNNEGYIDSNPSITKHNLIIPTGSPPSSTPIFSSIQKIFGKSAYEGGVEARIQFPTSLTNQLYTINNTNGITFSLWYNMSTSSGSWASIFEFSETAADTTNTRRFGIAREGLNNQIGLVIKDYIAKPTDYYYLGSVGSGTVNNAWHHIVWSISSTGVWTCYVDNVNQNINVTGKIPNITNYNFSYILGNIQSTQTVSYVDDFRIYDKVLSVTEVSILYHIPYVNNINTYTINFPVDTIANINDNTDYIFKGKYDINLTSLYSHIVPKENQKLGIITKFPTSTMKIKYNIYNPVNKLLLEPYVNNDNFYNGYVYENYIYTGTQNTAKYYKTFAENTICDILVVGGGGSGGGAGGSGGGGAVVEFLNVNIPAGDYVINVGRGGQNAVFASSSSVSGNNGNTSSFIGNNIDIKAAGGGGGSSYMTNNATSPPSVNYINPLTNTTQTSQGGGGGSGGNGQMAVAYVMNLTLSGRGGGNPYSGQTWTAGAGGGAAPASLGGNGGDSYTTTTAQSSLGFLGNGGKGIISAITNMEYGGGAAGSRWNATANNTIYGYATGGGGTCVLNGLNSTFIPADNGRGGGGYGAGNGGSGTVILRYRQYNPGSNLNNQKKLNFNYIPDTIVYDFTPFNNLADWNNYATSIGATTSFETYQSDDIWRDSEKLGFIRLPLTNYLYDTVTVTYKNGHTSGAVKIYINGIEKSSCAANETKTYTQKYVPGDILRIEEGFAELGANLIITLSNANIVNRYNINFPVNTTIDVNKENKSVILRGNYNIVNLPTSINSILTFTNTTANDTVTYTYAFDKATICDILIVAGGGGGGMNAGAGGGAGGLILLENIIISAGIYTINVGRGGAGGTTSDVNTFAEDGKNSSFGSYTAIGGGAGANSGGSNGRTGGSGGGTGDATTGNRTGGAGTPGQGFKGGDGTIPGGTNRTGGGGGGAGGPGQNSVSAAQAGNGGIGRNMSSYFGISYGVSGWFAGGGAGGVHGGTGGTGGTGGGGNENVEGINGTGGGGGAARSGSGNGKKGGSGIVIIKQITPSYSYIDIDKSSAAVPSSDVILYNKLFENKNIDLNYNTTIATSNIISEPTITSFNEYNLLQFPHSGGSENQTSYLLNIQENVLCDILIVAGGGAGGNDRGGGGGGGGVIYSENVILNGTYNILIGNGGIGATSGTTGGSGTRGTNGSDSSISGTGLTTLTAVGGGAGGSCASGLREGISGGSGGGGSQFNGAGSGGSGTIGQGKNGGVGFEWGAGGGGGGYTAVGTNASSTNAGNGGIGLPNSITGATIIYGSGGGGGGSGGTGSGTGNQLAGTGGSIGAGNGTIQNINGLNATINGCGGGGAGHSNGVTTKGGNGGTGIIIIRYKSVIPPVISVIRNFIEPSVTSGGAITPISIGTEYKYLSFTNDGSNQKSYSVNFPENTECDILIIAGGGGGGQTAGGGGGAGGLIYLTNQNISKGTYNINVGKGGSVPSGNGFNSNFDTYIAIGGGGGSTMDGVPGNGGSGGGGNRIPGATGSTAVVGQSGGTGTTNQGNNGGAGKNQHGNNAAGGGGGGAGAIGNSAFTTGRGADGGIGRQINITGTSIYYAGGGGGGSGGDFSAAGAGGQGGGGNGAIWANTGSAGINGTGGGGGGGSGYPGDGRQGGSGGSGIVIIRYRLTIIDVTSQILTKQILTKKYPEIPSTNSDSWIDNGYNVVCKTSDNIFDTRNTCYLFNNLIVSPDHFHSTQLFSGSSPYNYTGSTSFKGANGLVIYIDLGRSIVLSSMRMAPRDNAAFSSVNFLNAMPNAFKIYASNDNACWTNNNHSSWNEIHSQTSSLTYNYNQYTNFGNFSANITSYRYFAMVIYNLIGNYTYLTFSEWNIFGLNDRGQIANLNKNNLLQFPHSGGNENQTTYQYTFQQDAVCDILIVGGGGGGGADGAGGGGGGQVLYYTNDNVSFKSGNAITLNAGTYNINVGKGGLKSVSQSANASNGEISSITFNNSTIVSAGGGGGGGTVRLSSTGNNAIGGGGGNGHGNTSGSSIGGTSSAGGGTGGDNSAEYGGGGGGGANITGTLKNGGNATSSITGSGGAGVDIVINSVTYGSVTYGVGGGGSGGTHTNGGIGITSHGGGAGGNSSVSGTNGAVGTGGGGGGCGHFGAPIKHAGDGGSGIVIIRILYYINSNINPQNLLTFTNNELVNTKTYMHIFEQDMLCDVLIVGGGGGGSAGGGGGGGYIYLSNIFLNCGAYTIRVGNGGTGATLSTSGNQGFNSSLIGGYINYTAYGGGGGGGNGVIAPAHTSGQVGSYGGNGHDFVTEQTYTSTQGNKGGRALANSGGGGGGGGGAGAIGNNPEIVSGLSSQISATTYYRGGQGGIGIANNITGTLIFYAGGGTAGVNTNKDTDLTNKITVFGGGGFGSRGQNENGTDGIDGLGGGGGGGDWERTAGTKGGSGVVIIRIKTIVTTGILDGITHKKISFNYLFDKTTYNEYMAQYYTGGGRWRLVRYLPPTSTTWYPINDNLAGTTTVGTAYDYSNWWTLPFGTFDEFVFATFNMKYWLHVTRVQAIGTNYDNSPRTILRSSISNIPYTANWYNRAANGEDPWIGLRVHNTAPVNNPEAGGDLILYAENSFASGHGSLPAIAKDGGMCVFVRDSGMTTETHPLQSYEINFPVKTLADVNNTGVFSLVEGKYDINIGTFSSSITPKEGQYLQKPTTFTYNIPEERMYPPVRNFIAPSMFISGLSYGNGLYNVKYSTFRDSTEPFQIFNENNTTGGHWEEVAKYDTTTGIYIGTDSLGGYPGDWVTIQLPVAIRMTRYMFKQRPDVTNGSPRNFRIYGSNDGSTWVQLINRTDITYLNLYYNETNILLNGYYSYYGLVVNATIGNRNQLNFDEWYIYGYEMPMSALELRYQLLNPIKDPIGAQWTYNSSNTNVYHMGNVGIGTKLPEYSLHVDGYIYTSATAYTSSTKTKWTTVSDRRIKENIVKASYEKCLENVRNIELYRFNLNNNNVITNDKNQLGFIAQEVQKIYPKAVETNKIIDKNNLIPDLLTLNTTQIDYTLFGAVKELINKVENIGKKIENIAKGNEPDIEDNQNILSTPITNISLEELNNINNITENNDVSINLILANTSNIITIDTSDIAIDTSNIAIDTSNIAIDTSNIAIDTSDIAIDTSNIAIDTSNIAIDTSNIAIDTSNIAIDTSNIAIDTSNILNDVFNIIINTSDT